ncbi:hypothetical protein C10C_0532 [Chlamydia serpentis]|uniref:SprT-like domain-containing protein n=1 Tax=Chlamydia serpentis TaxID=1967782 RepID=A0A2R8FB90_9CHLA|nr:M48 family metallopeptidase [Chlamydia serpentis]SPN73693.1 hypothetical protein C10C_0532 [Chlamydia serpentis]
MVEVETLLQNFQYYLRKYFYKVLTLKYPRNASLFWNKSARRSSLPVDHSPGKFYDLQEIYKGLNVRLFRDALRLEIGWFGRKENRIGQSIVLGSFHEHEQLIRIHRSLDREEIPRFFMEYLVYHEMVHSVVPKEYTLSGRLIFHGKKFKEYEKRFPLYERAIAWEKANTYLLRGYKRKVGGGHGRTQQVGQYKTSEGKSRS